jgi:hypothetical protein
VLNRTDMVNFATIFVNFQKRGKTKDQAGLFYSSGELSRFQYDCSYQGIGRETRALDSTRFSRQEKNGFGFHSLFHQVCIGFDYIRWTKLNASARCVGVFDTVGSLGLPEEISLHWKDITSIFGFSDSALSPDIAYALQALAINETRADFVSMGISLG